MKKIIEFINNNFTIFFKILLYCIRPRAKPFTVKLGQVRAALDSAESGWAEADGDRDEIAAFAEELLAREKVCTVYI